MTPLEEKMCMALENYFFSRNKELWLCKYSIPKNKKINKKVFQEAPKSQATNIYSAPKVVLVSITNKRKKALKLKIHGNIQSS